MGDKAIVRVVLDNKTFYVPLGVGQTTAEDVVVFVCKELGIGTVARHIFALRDAKGNYLMPAELIAPMCFNYDLRVRYKVPNILGLKRIDSRAYEYYFHQVRLDIIESKILDIPFESHRPQLLGLGVTDMYRIMLEKGTSQEVVLNEYKKYIPKEVLNRHSIFVKKPIKDALSKLCRQPRSNHSAGFVIDAYLREFETMAVEYPLEEYKAQVDQDGELAKILLRVSPFLHSSPGIRYCFENEKTDKNQCWKQVCAIEQICSISIRNDFSIEINRDDATPFYINFNSLSKMRSFVSLVDGYYRLSVKWITNICKDVLTPSLTKLNEAKFHGPVGGEFSYFKLEDKRSNYKGTYIIRESESVYNLYFIDVSVGENKKPVTYRLERTQNDEFILQDDAHKYSTLTELKLAYKDPDGTIYLRECLPPLENDNSPLLLCKNNSIGDDLEVVTEENLTLLNPIFINNSDLRIFTASRNESSSKLTFVYKGKWKHSKKKMVDISLKVIKAEYRERYMPEVFKLVGKWAFLQSNAIVKLYGITLQSELSLVMEYLSLGCLSSYLRENKAKLKDVDLLEACSNLASALWYLSEKDIIHGNIRCKKLLVSLHSTNCFKVKLSHPGIYSTYSIKDIHWIPAEFLKNDNMDVAKHAHTTDIWAFATTLYEIYSFGATIPHDIEDYDKIIQYYKSGERLPEPAVCPDEIYQILLQCWSASAIARPHPQIILRDINQILYTRYNSRRQHIYTDATNPSEDRESLDYNISMTTETTSIATSDSMSVTSSTWSLASENTSLLLPPELDSAETFFSKFHPNAHMQSGKKEPKMREIFELDGDRQVELLDEVGKGCFGKVYRGMLHKNGNQRWVAVKKLTSQRGYGDYADFEREICIMETLKHRNVVEIVGNFTMKHPREETILGIVMEFVPGGSLENCLLHNTIILTPRLLLKFSLDIAEGMDYLGRKQVVHRDLATRNILVVDEQHVKISDFGLAQFLNENNYYIARTERQLPLRWYAFESICAGKFSTKSDVWSYGVTLIEMFNPGRQPLLPNEKEDAPPKREEIMTALENGLRLARPEACPQLIYNELIYPCWYPDPQKRPSFYEIREKVAQLSSRF